MSKLSNATVRDRKLAESEVKKATYDKMKAPDGKSRQVGKPKDTSSRVTRIKQVEVPAGHKGGGKKSSASSQKGGIPQAGYAGDEADKTTVPGWSKGIKAESPPTPPVKKDKPNQTSKMKQVNNAIKRTEGGKSAGANTIPQADMAGKYTSKMPHGGSTLKASGNGVPTVKADKPKNLNGTTRPSKKPASMKTRPVNSQHVTQVKHDGKQKPAPAEAPKTPKWQTKAKGHNVMESVQIVLNGKPKASFDIVDRSVVKKIVENYRSYGYDVKVQRGGTAAWKKDRDLIRKIYECVDAHYNNAPVSSRRLRKEALNRFFQVNQASYNQMYESKQNFVHTLRAAFDRVMERADLNYRRNLQVIEGLARVEVGDEIYDLELITQARDETMALRQFRDEIVEAYGFSARIKHIFVEGEKKTPADIVEWAEAKN